MRIIGLAEFRNLPEGTLFCKYEPCNFGQLELKGETWDVDFLTANIIADPLCNSSNEYTDILEKAVKTGESFPLQVEVFGRDGSFNKEQLFAIYEEADIKQLMGVLKNAIEVFQPTD